LSKRTTERKRTAVVDPYREREARKYSHPIASRELILQRVAERGTPVSFEDLVLDLALSEESEQEALRRRLGAMVRDGQLVQNRRRLFCLVNRKDLIAGRVIGHADGFGFVRPDEGGDDLYLAAREMRALFDGDRVVVRVTGIDRRGRREGAVVEILERGLRRIVGRLRIEGGIGFVTPDNQRLHHEVIVPPPGLGEGKTGEIVVAEVVDFPTRHSEPVGKIVEVLGEHLAPGMETDIAIRAYDLPIVWPEAVEQEIAGLGAEVDESAKLNRADLRGLPLVTIDGADARDFDDAVACVATPKGWRLTVAIADVSAYVERGTALDGEGRLRGNSVYFPDRVIPMLPEVLSNGLCSLNPHVDRLCMACEMQIDASGEIRRSRFFPAVMRSHARLTYDEVAAILVDCEPGIRARHSQLVPHLERLHALYKVLRQAREDRGAIDFDTVETRIVFDDLGKIDRILPVERNEAHLLIEECMLAANVSAARLLLRKRIPALFRVHEGPPVEKITELREFLGELGLSLPGREQPTAKDYSALLSQIEGRPDAHLIQTVLLRSLAQARYSAQNTGHFGLGFPAYTHFTSPIRRYPDLVVHRAIKHLLTGAKADSFEHSAPELQTLGEHCSTTERRADEATRDAVAWLKCEYMLDRVGEELSGIISGVSSFGLFVELDGIYVDGLLHITSLDNDYYHFDPVGRRLTGERSGRVYRLGDPIRVRVAQVNLDERKIDFVLPDESRAGRRSDGRRGRGKPKRRAGDRGREEAASGVRAESAGTNFLGRKRRSRKS